MFEEAPPLPSLLAAIQVPMNPIGMRMRSAYYLRHAYNQGAAADEDVVAQDGQGQETSIRQDIVEALIRELRNKDHGSLMRHEFAYVLGQLQDGQAIDELEACVSNQSDCVMVRHEFSEFCGLYAASL